jgi:nitrite reductase/ring-hydroxylating ferredoxin subunit
VTAFEPPGKGQIVCKLADLPENDAKGFAFRDGERVRKILIVRRGDELRCYRNICPHAGVPLDWVPDKFMNRARTFLVCQAHGALFEIDDGYCIEGPCAGDSLRALKVAVEGDEVRLLD